MRAHADDYGIDPERIGVIGGSAGGHLTAMLGVTAANDQLEGDGLYAEHSTVVSAVVPLYPPADLVFRAHDRELWDGLTKAQRELCDVAAPVTYIDAHDPPMLILHGTNDKTVSVEQSRRLAAACKKSGMAVQLEIIEDAPHSFHLQPKQKDLRPLVLKFFDKHLKNADAVVR